MEAFVRSKPTSFELDERGRVKNYSSRKDEIRDELMALTKGHCSYCDKRISRKDSMIEHFRPKAENRFPELEMVWSNLFISCMSCNQTKGYKFPDLEPLKPDAEEYKSFEHWFFFDSTKNTIEPNLFLTENEKERVRKTIGWLELNHDERREAREEERYKMRNETNLEHKDKFSYRYMLRQRLSSRKF